MPTMLGILAGLSAIAMPNFRPPAVPLVTHTPFFSVWSTSDTLNERWPTHWTGRPNAIAGMVRIDGKAYAFCGNPAMGSERMRQTGVRVHPTRTVYTFEADGVEVEATFLSPLFLDDLDTLAKPLSYLRMAAKSTDGRTRKVQFYVDATAEWSVDRPSQQVLGSRFQLGGLPVASFRANDNRPLNRSGDDQRIDWGTFYLAALTPADSSIATADVSRAAFVQGSASPDDELRFPRRADDGWIAASLRFDLGEVGDKPAGATAAFAYDEEYAFEYLGRKIKPLWAENGATMSDLLQEARTGWSAMFDRAEKFDNALEAKLEARGGAEFRQMCALAYRQSIAAHGLGRDIDGTLLMFSKENYSNGCIGTVDVTYPGAPLYLDMNPALLRAQIEPILEYAATPRWKFPFAPHDLGQYPLANGQVYGGGERTEENQMPVEECGNMLALVAAYTAWSGDDSLAKEYQPLLKKWADYLVEFGLDPANQLCTDDFAGHLARNANLSVKAIVGIAAYGKLFPKDGTYSVTAKKYAGEWLKLADANGRTRLTFDRPDSWSMKYNMVWDKLLNLGLWSNDVVREEIAYYKSKQNEFGLPLDDRADYTKLDWIYWTAAMTENQADFDALISPTFQWAHTTPTRVPLTDWYDTKNGRMVGFQARSVVGGLWMPMLKVKK